MFSASRWATRLFAVSIAILRGEAVLPPGAFGFQLSRVHLRQHLPGLHEVAFAHHDILKATRCFRGNIDLHRLDPAVTGHEPGGKSLPVSFDQKK